MEYMAFECLFFEFEMFAFDVYFLGVMLYELFVQECLGKVWGRSD